MNYFYLSFLYANFVFLYANCMQIFFEPYF